jgi:ABC-type transport system involved in cytochrome c biogenesis permease subunit
MAEALTLQFALLGYLAAGGASLAGLRWRAPVWPLAAIALAFALAMHTLALATRWQSLGHGPFTTLHEILSSNLWSLALVFALAAALVREVRHALWAAAPWLLLLAAWLVVSDPRAGHLPPTYDTPLLYLHTLVGKLFLGLLLVAVALGAVPWLRRSAWGERAGRGFGDAARLDELAHRFAAFAFVFETLMLIVGAIWAQDAWGRYWAWDPLETWAFATWLALAMTLHARATFRPSPAAHGAMLAAVFVIAFLTFFGVPFISMAPHKGAV